MMPNKSDNFARLVAVADQKRKEREEAARLAGRERGTTVVPSYHEQASSGTTDIGGSRGTTKTPWSRPNLDQLNLKIPKQIKAKFEMWCALEGLSMAQGFAVLVERGTTGSSSSGGSGGTTLLIDDISPDGEIDDVIIPLYQQLTGNKFTDADRTALSEVSTIPAERIQVGIALSVFRAKNRVNSFRYCLGAIREAAEAPIADVRPYLAHVKARIRKTKGRETK